MSQGDTCVPFHQNMEIIQGMKHINIHKIHHNRKLHQNFHYDINKIFSITALEDKQVY